MKNILLSVYFILAMGSIKAQINLVFNPSFELYDTCPPSSGSQLQIQYALGWMNPLTSTSPDFFDTCASFYGIPQNYNGYELAHTGQAYAGFITYAGSPTFYNAREYLETNLIDTLKAGVNYCIRFYVSAGDSSRYISNDIGIYFSPTLIDTSCGFCVLPYIPQFENASSNSLSSRNGWTEVSGSYTAFGNEKFIVIGNFKDSVNTIATYTGWNFQQQQHWAYYYIDDIMITPCDSLLTGNAGVDGVIDIRIYPNPSNGIYYLQSQKTEIEKIEAYNVVGELIYYDKTKSNNFPIDISNQSNGIYLLKAFTKKDVYQFKLIKNN